MDEIAKEEAQLLAILHQDGPEKDVLESFYNECLPIICKVAVKYVNLDVATGSDDLKNEAYFSVVETFYRFRSGYDAMKITNYLVWMLKKAYAKSLPFKDRLVIIIYPDGYKRIVSYQKLQKTKKLLPPGTQFTVISRIVSYDDIENPPGFLNEWD